MGFKIGDIVHRVRFRPYHYNENGLCLIAPQDIITCETKIIDDYSNIFENPPFYKVQVNPYSEENIRTEIVKSDELFATKSESMKYITGLFQLYKQEIEKENSKYAITIECLDTFIKQSIDSYNSVKYFEENPDKLVME